MIYKVERMATSKKYASEDASFWMENGDVIVAGVFDGCGGAQESHFASNLFMRALRSIIKDSVEYLDNLNKDLFGELMHTMCLGIQAIAGALELTYFQLQSTVVFAVYTRSTKTLKFSILGDGFIHYRNAEGWNHIALHLPENAPDYLGYYILGDEDKLKENIASREFYIIDNVEEWSIGSDGIDSIKTKTSNVVEFMLEGEMLSTSEAMLERKTNILLKSGAELGDDLTIIRYIPDESIQQAGKTDNSSEHQQTD